MGIGIFIKNNVLYVEVGRWEAYSDRLHWNSELENKLELQEMVNIP
jgi:hypothetical protein